MRCRALDRSCQRTSLRAWRRVIRRDATSTPSSGRRDVPRGLFGIIELLLDLADVGRLEFDAHLAERATRFLHVHRTTVELDADEAHASIVAPAGIVDAARPKGGQST